MRDCERCGKPVDGEVCSACGYSPATKRGAAPARPHWLPDAWDSVEQLVEATRAAYLARGRRDVGATPQDCVAAARRLAIHFSTAPRDGKAWARKILEEHRQGRYYPVIAIQNAREAMRITHIEDDPEATEERVAIQAEQFA